MPARWPSAGRGRVDRGERRTWTCRRSEAVAGPTRTPPTTGTDERRTARRGRLAAAGVVDRLHAPGQRQGPGRDGIHSRGVLGLADGARAPGPTANRTGPAPADARFAVAERRGTGRGGDRGPRGAGPAVGARVPSDPVASAGGRTGRRPVRLDEHLAADGQGVPRPPRPPGGFSRRAAVPLGLLGALAVGPPAAPRDHVGPASELDALDGPDRQAARPGADRRGRRGVAHRNRRARAARVGSEDARRGRPRARTAALALGWDRHETRPPLRPRCRGRRTRTCGSPPRNPISRSPTAPHAVPRRYPCSNCPAPGSPTGPAW